jgi:hypothetical protein
VKTLLNQQYAGFLGRRNSKLPIPMPKQRTTDIDTVHSQREAFDRRVQNANTEQQNAKKLDTIAKEQKTRDTKYEGKKKEREERRKKQRERLSLFELATIRLSNIILRQFRHDLYPTDWLPDDKMKCDYYEEILELQRLVHIEDSKDQKETLKVKHKNTVVKHRDGKIVPESEIFSVTCEHKLGELTIGFKNGHLFGPSRTIAKEVEKLALSNEAGVSPKCDHLMAKYICVVIYSVQWTQSDLVNQTLEGDQLAMTNNVFKAGDIVAVVNEQPVSSITEMANVVRKGDNKIQICVDNRTSSDE